MFQNASMKQRENRLQAARTDAKRSIRELKRDRNELERVEKQLMTQLRMQIKRGDLPKAQMIATTIGHYRNVSDRNFARSIWIQAQSQIHTSNHRINQAQVESLKGMSFVNGVESVDSMRARTTKYHHRKDEVETIESILNEGFDDIYEEIESEQINPVFFDAQVAAIIKEAQDAKLKMRDYGSQNTDMISKILKDHIHLKICLFESDKSSILSVPNLGLSIDLLRSYIFTDANLMKKLGIACPLSCIQIGERVIDEKTREASFCAFNATWKSLEQHGIVKNGIVWVSVAVIPTTEGNGTNSNSGAVVKDFEGDN